VAIAGELSSSFVKASFKPRFMQLANLSLQALYSEFCSLRHILIVLSVYSRIFSEMLHNLGVSEYQYHLVNL
jgi:hypothetical protein